MMSSDIIKKSKFEVLKKFFKIRKLDSGKFVIDEYNGITKSKQIMESDGWYLHPYLVNYINEDYPIFNVLDFKSSDGKKIEKITNEDILTAELIKYYEYLKLSPSLVENIKNFSLFLTQFNFSKNIIFSYNTFTDLKNNFYLKLNNYSLQQNEIEKYNLIFLNFVNEILLNLEKIKINNSHLFWENKFKYFFTLIEV